MKMKMTAYCVLNTLFRYHDKIYTYMCSRWAGVEIVGTTRAEIYERRVAEGTRSGRKSVTALSHKANIKIFELLQYFSVSGFGYY